LARFAVDISGNTIAVSAPFADLPGSEDRGVIYIFERSSDVWNLTAQLTTLNGQSGDKIGMSLSLEDDILAVGAPFVDGDGVNNRGAVYIYVRPSSGWADMTETAKLTASDGAEDDWLGNSIAMHGDWLIAGAPHKSAPGMYAFGAVYVYQKPFGGWITTTETEKLLAPVPMNYEKFGYVVDVRGNTLGVGCSTQSPTKVYAYRLNAGNWVFESYLSIPGGVPDYAFGRSIAVGNEEILVGSFAFVAGNPDAGHVYLYLWDGAKWDYNSTITSSDGIPDDRFGWSMASDGVNFLVGATNAGGGGKAYLFVPGPGVSITPSSLELFEGGLPGTYSVSLKTQPSSDVTISAAHDAQLSVDPTTLLFTAQNWDLPQTITVLAVDDDIDEGNHTSIITHTSTSADTNYQDIDIGSVNVSIREGTLYSVYLSLILR
jgi:hypothetical protein